MQFPRVRCKLLLCAGLLITILPWAKAFGQPAISKDEIKHFLLTATIVNAKPTHQGVTGTWRLTLSDGTLTHDASFQSVNESKPKMEFASGRMELNFIDSYKYNIAAYTLAEMLGIDDLLPVYVERKWKGNTGSLSWWLPVKMDEQARSQQGLHPPDPEAWNRQMYKIRLFDQLVYDTDPNLTNVLIGDQWQLWRVDFTRAFRLYKDPPALNDLARCDRLLFQNLKTLDMKQVMDKTRGYLGKEEVKAMMVRRDKIVQHIQRLIAEKGENEILY
jgi:hypothetical protein